MEQQENQKNESKFDWGAGDIEFIGEEELTEEERKEAEENEDEDEEE